MKIGFLITNLNAGGAERATVSLSDFFVEHGHETEIITFENKDSFYELNEKIQLCSAGFEEIEHSASLKRFFGTVVRMFKLRKLVQKKKLDVLVGMSYSMTWYAVFATIFSHTKSIGTERNNPYKYRASTFNTLLRKIFYRLSNGFIFQTEKSSHFFTDNLRENDIVIPNAIFNEAVYELQPPSKREKVICSVGRLTAQKRFDVLIDAFKLIEEKHPDYKLIIFGEGELRNELQAQIDRLGLSGKVLLPGSSPEAIKLVNRTSVFVLSSDMEGMPNALMEAIALGVPCVSTRCEMGPEELIDDGVNGLLVETGNPQQIAEAVEKILDNPEFAQALSANGRKMIKTHSIDSISNKWIEFLKNIVS